mgnify:CR=1 FL=1
MERFLLCKKKNSKGKELLKILQENYEIETAQDISSALKDMFKDALQEMMNVEY